MSLNYCVFMGRMVRDPELRHTQNGTSVTTFSLAVERDFKGKDGKKETDFVDIVAWRSTAEYVCKNFKKGHRVVASGRLTFRDWTDKDGNRRRVAEVVSDAVYFADKYEKVPDYRSLSYEEGQYVSTGEISEEGAYPGEEGMDIDGELPF